MSVAIAPQLNIKVARTFTLEEYLRKEETSVERHEFHDGKIIKMPNAKFYHNLIASNTLCAIKNIIRATSKKYLILGDGQKVYIEAENVAVYPDALVVCEQPVFHNNLESILTNPVLIVEVLSRSTHLYDRAAKFDLYKLLPSFKEYVLIDSRKCAVETRFQEAPKLWRMHNETDMNKSIRLNVFESMIELKDIYEDVVFKVKTKK
jgi:Uma2 family endonuclease